MERRDISESTNDDDDGARHEALPKPTQLEDDRDGEPRTNAQALHRNDGILLRPLPLGPRHRVQDLLPRRRPPRNLQGREGPEEPSEVGLQKLRGFGFALVTANLYKLKLTNGLKDQQKSALEIAAFTWLFAAALHVEPCVKKTQPKEICLQQFVAMPLTALA